MRNERLTELTETALAFHAGQTDLQGKPYGEHVLAVANGVQGGSTKAVALFHDALEDGVATEEQLAEILTTIELKAVKLLTRGSEPYSDYIGQLSIAPGVAGVFAREVKESDLRHNLSRMTPETERLRNRYEAALTVLKG